MKKNALVMLSVFWSVVLCQAVVADQAGEKAAVEAASQWVALVDAGKYPQSWDNAAGYFKTAVKKDQWGGFPFGCQKAPRQSPLEEPEGKTVYDHATRCT